MRYTAAATETLAVWPHSERTSQRRASESDAMSDDRPQFGRAKVLSEAEDLAKRYPAPLRSLLRQQGSFVAVNDNALKLLEQRMGALQYRQGDIIFDEGDPGAWTFVVTAGEVEVTKRARDGAMIQVNVLHPGDWGGMMSLFNNMRRSARLVAREDVEIRVLGHDDLAKILQKEPSLAMGLLALMSQRLAQDAIHLAATLRHVSVVEPEDVYQHFSPDERLMLETIRHRVAAAESLNEIMDFVFESIHRVRACDRMSLLFIEDGGSRAFSYWTRATYEPLILPADYKEDLADSALEESLDTGRPRIINDIVKYAEEHPSNRAALLLVREQIRSSVIMPLIVGGKAVAFLVSCSRQVNAYDEHHALLHQAVAASISQAVEKAYRIEQLTHANNYYSEILGFVSHELQSPIASMVTDAKLLVDGYLGELNEQQRRKLESSISKGQYLLNLVRDYLNLSRLEDKSLKADIRPDINLRTQVIEPVIELVSTELTAKHMSLERHYADNLPSVECDAGIMRIALGNLLTNAVKYGREGGSIRLHVEADGSLVHLTVWNEGPGFASADRTKLFRKFVRLGDPQLKKEKGTGLGLYSTWRILQLHHGRVTARSEQGAWAEFSLSFPVRQPDVDPSV